jgi:hypothetical protein
LTAQGLPEQGIDADCGNRDQGHDDEVLRHALALLTKAEMLCHEMLQLRCVGAAMIGTKAVAGY